MSYKPEAVGALLGHFMRLLAAVVEYQATSSSGPYRASVLPARAAYSHSASVGSRPPAQPQNAVASSQLTFTMGMSWLFQPSLKFGAAGICAPVLPANLLYAATVTSVWPSQKPFVIVT